MSQYGLEYMVCLPPTGDGMTFGFFSRSVGLMEGRRLIVLLGMLRTDWEITFRRRPLGHVLKS